MDGPGKYSVTGLQALPWLALTGLFLGVVSGCSTQEYRNAHNLCERRWLVELPPEYITRPVNRIRYVEVPDGTQVCTREIVHDKSDSQKEVLQSREECRQGTRTEEVPYVAVETLDKNALRRETLIFDCVSDACLHSHGNTECKAGQ